MKSLKNNSLLFLEPINRGAVSLVGYSPFMMSVSFCRSVVRHGKKQVGEEVQLQVINIQDLRAFRDQCSLDEGKGRTTFSS